MPSFKSTQLINSLENTVQQTIASARRFKTLDKNALCHAAEGKWSIVQILYHLNSYNNYYLPHINDVIKRGSNIPAAATFKAGLIGNYFTNAMLPGSNNTIKNPMKAPADHVPDTNYDDLTAIDGFIEGQTFLLQLLHEARQVNMTRLKVPISISKFIKIRLGDTFRFLVAHQQRHFVQINTILKLQEA